MAAGPAGEAAGDDQLRADAAAEALADRLAAELAHHEPGWRLPRHTTLARRYNVSSAQIDAAISKLADRHLIRRLPGGQVYRVSPVEYLIPLAGVPGLGSRVDPLGVDLICRDRQTSWHRVPEDISRALRADPAEPVCVVRAVWIASGEPAAYTTTYLPADMAGTFLGSGMPPARSVAGVTAPAALHVEVRLPPPSIARRLRLSAGQPAAMVIVRFDDPATGQSAALTVAVLRPELFRIVVQTTQEPLPGDRTGFRPAGDDERPTSS
jgi:DNA-binding GntR family transcriptional regulator